MRLRNRKTSPVKSGESLSSTPTLTGVFRFLNNLARPALSPESSNPLRKKIPKDDGMMIATC